MTARTVDVWRIVWAIISRRDLTDLLEGRA